MSKIKQQTYIELLVEYDYILENLQEGNYTEEDLDNYLLIFSEQLSKLPTVNKKNQTIMEKQTLKLIQEQNKMIQERDKKSNIRLNSYFNDELANKVSKTVDTAKPIDTEFELPKIVESNFYLSIRNNIAEQSDINRIRSLVNTGGTLTEAIKTIIPKNKHNIVRKLHKVQFDEATKLEEARRRLY